MKRIYNSKIEKVKNNIGEGKMTREKIKELFAQGIDCSQVVAGKEDVSLFWRWYDVR